MYPVIMIYVVFSLVLVLNVPILYGSNDYFMLAEEWPTTYCKSRIQLRNSACIKQPTIFTIHGVWPQNNSGPQPLNCDPLQRNQLDKKIVSIYFA